MRPNYDPADRPRLEEWLHQRRLNGETFEQICATPGWPTRPTLRKWLRENPVVADYAREARRAARAPENRFAFEPRAAEELIRRVRWGEAIRDLIREPHLPQRRALNAWKRGNQLFAVELAAAKAFAEPERRRYGRRRSRLPYDEAAADRIMLAVMRGATLPALGRDRTLPSATGLKRWRRAHPDFDAALKSAMVWGHKARGRARVDAHCTAALTERIEFAIVEGASLASLAQRPDMPSPYALYKWVRDRPAFAAAVAKASEFRDDFLLGDQAFDLAQRGATAQAAALRKRLGQLNPHPGARRRKP